ncbi:MAG: fatty acyl-AMP ligase [Cyanobacteriota bacterium]|mgnify:CR=1 FL=1
MNTSNIVEKLKLLAINNSDLLAYCMVSKNEIIDSYTYKDLDNRAKSIAGFLQSKNLNKERVIIALPQSLDFIAAFFGCLYAGVMVVPSYPPYNQKQTKRIKSIAKDSQADFIIASNKVINLFDSSDDSLEINDFKFIDIDEIKDDFISNYKENEIKIDDIAFIQYTSGSTGLPKGVVINHENIMTNVAMLGEVFRNTSKDIFGGWLPFFHDMGLVTMILRTIYFGSTAYLMTPIDFIKNPISWLEMISKYKITDSGSPNFGYDACFNEISDDLIKNLDLSHWRVAFNGAEPIREMTIKNFSQKFSSTGFKEESFLPCYGMAEVTVFISGSMGGDLPVFESISTEEFEKGKIKLDIGKNSKMLVSSGRLPSNEIIKIVNPDELTSCNNSEIGEIWVSGKHVGKGYWNKPEISKQIFEAFTTDTNEGPFLRTGDLGFMKNGELFITGRLKDLIIIRGKNYAPQDIEFVAESVNESIKNNCSSAFSIDVNDEEVLIIIAEIDKKYSENIDIEKIKNLVRRKVSSECGLSIYDFVLIKNNTIPRTTSGKIQRSGCKKAYLENNLSIFENTLVKSI